MDEMKGLKKYISVSISLILIISVIISNIYFIKPFVIPVNAGNISSAWHNTSTLNLTIMSLLPRVNYYDFQYNNSGTWVSRLNQQIDVNGTCEYRFIIPLIGSIILLLITN